MNALKTAPKKQDHFAVPLEMGTRLRQIAAKKNCASIFDLLSEYVQGEIENGTIPRDIPGIEVSADGETVKISANQFALAVQRQLAGVMADRLREIATTGGTATVGEARLKRTGSYGLKIERTDNGTFLGLSDSTAKELADLIADVAK